MIAIAKEQTFRLVAPRVTANAIINAASPELFTLPQCARLLLVAAQAVGTSWLVVCGDTTEGDRGQANNLEQRESIA